LITLISFISPFADIDRGQILELLRKNVEANAKSDTVRVRELDFFRFPEDQNDCGKDEEDFSVEVVLAADVVYDPEVTEAFFRILKTFLDSPNFSASLLPTSPIILLAIERRERAVQRKTSVAHLAAETPSLEGTKSTTAPNFDLFLKLLSELESECKVKATPVIISTIPQRFQCYERLPSLHLWRIEKIMESKLFPS